ncbi:protein phosphatase 2C domain-containing protein [Streptomyces sp. NPDC006654]|uniref:protein phosphatase 2C domain-containing protein n=1 Tax=Streptomyces sp. NPDC006654 TaxID=3156897 RepID=UPI0033C1654A
MSQPGGRPTRHEDDWWGQLYDDSTEDTGPTAAPDSLDDRFASAKKTVGGRRGGGADPDLPDPPPPSVPPQRRAAPETPTRRPPVPDPPTRRPPVPDPPERRAADTGRRGADEGVPAAPAPWPWDEEDQDPLDADDDTPPSIPYPPRTAPPDPPPTTRLQPPALPAEPPYSPPPSPLPGEPPHSAPVSPPHGAAAPPPAAPAAPSAPPSPPAPSPAPPSPAPPSPAVPTAVPAPSPPAAVAAPASSVEYVGSGPPTYDAEPTAMPVADPDGLGDLVADTVLDGARYGACTLRAVSQRGDSARYRGEPRRDALLTARFGSGDQALVLVAMATGARATPGAHRAAAEVCELIARAVGRSHQRLTEDIQAARRGDLKSGLHRLTDRSLGKLRASAAEQGVAPEEYTASLRCLLLPGHPQCRTRVFFGVGEGGLFRLRDGEWQDIEPRTDTDAPGEPVLGFGSQPSETPSGDRLTMDLGIPTPPSPYEPAPEPPRDPFLFRASVARPGDALVMCTGGLAEPLRGEPALCAYLARRWSGRTPPGLAAFLADAQVRVKGYADDRTAAAVWEA